MVLVAAVLIGCGARHRDDLPRPTAPIGLLAVLPIESEAPPEEGRTPLPGASRPRVSSDAGAVVTAQVYGALTDRSDFRYVPDLTVASVLRDPSVTGKMELAEQAAALGKLVDADAVIFGTVWRFQERVGTEYGARQPASVAFSLGLVETATGNVLWTGRFDETQQPLTADFFKFWMFWDAGARWLTARELIRLGVDRLLPEMFAAAEDYTEPEKP